MIKPQYVLEKLKASFWFIPILMLLITIGSAIGLLYLDSQVQFSNDGALRYLLTSSVDSAKSILTIIAGGMIGVAGTVFSITLVVLTLASSHLGSRLEAMTTISTFSRNKNQQKLIIQHAKMIMKAAEKSFSEKRDLEDMKKRFKSLKEKQPSNE